MAQLDFSQFLLSTGDLCFLAGLVLMAMLSAGASHSIEASRKVPMQFGFDGKPTWFASRRFALLFAPTLAAGFGLFLTYMAHTKASPDLTKEAVSLGTSRVFMALTFVFAHMLHLAIALAWLKKNPPR